jgi:outer membrane protein assembly factor BamB
MVHPTTMKTRICYLLFAAAFVACGLIALAQSRGGNWPTYGGDAQRSGWEGADAAISKDTVKNLQLIWKTKLETQSRGMRPVMPPIIQGRLISYRGFKELAFVATNADIVYAIDADVGTLFWQKHLEYSTREPQVTTSTPACPGGLTAMPTMPVPGRGGAAGRGAPAPAGGQRGSTFIGGPPSVYAISSDGRLHRLNTSTGDDMTQPVSVLPANARASSLNMVDNVIYTTTSHDCGDAPDAVWSIDLNADPPKVRSFVLDGGTSTWSVGGPVIGNDGNVHVPVISRAPLKNSDVWAIGLQSLTARELKPMSPLVRQGRFDAEASSSAFIQIGSPVVFAYKDRDLVASVCSISRLCIFEPAAGSGAPTFTPTINQTPVATKIVERGIWGSLSTWQDASGARWVFAPVTGPLNPDVQAPLTNGPAPNGSIVAFRVEEINGNPRLSPAWVSRDLDSPLPPVVVNGVVFALSAGEFTRQVKVTDGVTSVDERPRGSSSHATLYAFDAQTGKELYSSRNQVNVPASLTGITVANGRVYFGGIDGTVYAFGMYMER